MNAATRTLGKNARQQFLRAVPKLTRKLKPCCSKPREWRAIEKMPKGRSPGIRSNDASVFPIAILHLPDDDRDGRCVDAGSLHQHGGALYVVGVYGIEEVVDLANGRHLLQHQRALEVCFRHRSPR